jgi:uracil-DNA glycosylase
MRIPRAIIGEAALASGTSVDSAAHYLPDGPSSLTLAEVRRRAAVCRACPLYLRGTQTVFGEGPAHVRFVLVGEQPGDQEDKAGRPFVGPAGKLLDRALVEAGIDRDEVYVTNAVKHFKWTPVGKRRLHAKPNAREIAACRPWLDAELAHLRPAVVIALGATAAQALKGKAFRVTVDRGRPFRDVPGVELFFATIHPSAILRGPPEDRARAFQELVADLRKAAQSVLAGGKASSHKKRATKDGEKVQVS